MQTEENIRIPRISHTAVPCYPSDLLCRVDQKFTVFLVEFIGLFDFVHFSRNETK
jgi:hypothetical protein